MITDKQIQKAIREAPAGGKERELRDDGERGAGRLVLVIKPRTGRVTAEFYAVYYRGGRRAKAKLGSYPTIPVVEARSKFLMDYAPVIAAGGEPASAIRRQQMAINGSVTELFTAYVRIKDAKDIGDVRDQVLATFNRFTKETVEQATLDATRSRIRYSFALRMNSSPAIAASLAPYILLRRTPDTINKVFGLYQQVTPQDIQAMAVKYFTENNRTIITLASTTGTR